jgi:hypothetical protein
MHTFRRATVLKVPLLAIVIAVLISGGCVGHSQQLRDVQDQFNQANQIHSQSTSANTLTAEQEKAFRQIAQKIEKEQLKSVERDDLKVAAYAIDAFSKWRLKEFAAAKSTAEKGLDIYERAGLTSNQRDLGMLLITGGLADYSQTFLDYQKWLSDNPHDFLPKNDAMAFSNRIAAAMQKIDAVNRPDKGLQQDVAIVIYANQQQLLAITSIIDIWGQVRDSADRKGPVCQWTTKAKTLVQERFPPTDDYPGKALTDDLATKIAAVGMSNQCGG